MKARIIKDKDNRILYLHHDGAIIPVTKHFIRFFIFNFKSNIKGSFELSEGESPERWISPSCTDMSVYEGETLGYLNDNLEFVACSPEVFSMLEFTSALDSYITLSEFAKKWNKSTEIIKVFCRNNRIPGAVRMHDRWLIPKDAIYPVDPDKQRS